MLDVGFSELLLILAAAAVFLRPQDLPAVVRALAKGLRQLKTMTTSVRAQVKEVVGELDTTTIIDLEGKSQPAYDVRDLASLKRTPHEH